MEHSQVIIRPVVSEKSYVLSAAERYTFRVHPDAHKTQIRQAVEALFDVHVVEVRTISVKSKPKRRGDTRGRTRTWKKAIVQLARRRNDPDLPRTRGSRGLESYADPQAQAHESRYALRVLPGLRRDHQDRAREDARSKGSRRAAGATRTAARPRVIAAAAPSALYRRIDFKRRKDGVPAKVAAIEYDPNRSAYIALLHYADGEKRYILAPQRLTVGMTVASGEGADIATGNCLELARMPVGTVVHNVELQPGRGGQLARSAGASVQLMAKDGEMATLSLPSARCAWCAPSAGRRLARSATPSTRT